MIRLHQEAGEKPRYRVPARRASNLVLAQPAFVDGSAAAQTLRDMADQCDRGEVVSVAIAGQRPNGDVTTHIEFGQPLNAHCLISGCMRMLRRIQKEMESW